MRACVGVACVAVCLVSCAAGWAEAARVNPEDLDNLYSTLYAPNATESPRQLQTEEGFLRFVGVPPGTYFSTRTVVSKSLSPEIAAQTFVGNHLGAFAKPSARIAFTTERVSGNGNQSFVRLHQTYNGLTVYAAQMVVQTEPFGGVVSVLSDIMRDPTPFDDDSVSLTPPVSVDTAQRTAAIWAAGQYDQDDADFVCGTGQRMVYDPSVVGATGPLTVVWVFVISNTVSGNAKPVKDVVLVDGHSGQVVFSYPLIHDVKARRIYDANRQFTYLGTLVRAEGDPACNIADADLAYDYFGDTYDFYKNVNGRDSINNQGMTIAGTVRLCVPGQCPFANAFYVMRAPGGEEPSGETFLPDHMYFGEGFASADDVIGHELTHGVTSYESNLIYAYQSGAINESFSDIWGEFIDLTNGRGNDSADVRWLLGEDLPSWFGVIRNMKNPPEFFNPDRVGSPYYYTGPYDNGGVHINSGVINKLCYLLTDGDTFNGRTVRGMGIERVADLFYEAQTNLLTEASDFNDLYMQLGQATVNLGYSLDDRLNVRRAALAVEIAPDLRGEMIGAFRAIPTLDATGRPVIAVVWANPTSPNFRRVVLVRDTKTFPLDPSDGVEIYRGTDEQFADRIVATGTEYFYTIFSQMTAGFPDARSTRAITATVPADFLTESFSADDAFDLSYTQILLSPTGTPGAAVGEQPLAPSYYSHYMVTLKKNIFELPVPREDERGGAYNLPLRKDAVEPVMTAAPFPFFGIHYDKIYLATNGYVAFEEVKEGDPENSVVSPATHFAVPRLSFLFADLAPDIGGSIWARFLDDRMVVTFEDVPEMETQVYPPARNPNTVQVELFYTGHIRITYLGVHAERSVVGLSDGQGMPIDPALLFAGLRHVTIQSDLSAMPETITTLSFEPLPVQRADAGGEISFVARTKYPAGSGTPTLSAEWTGSGVAPFADSRDGTGVFRWQTSLLDYGVYTARIIATAGEMSAYQDITLAVDAPEPLPEATHVLLRTNDPVEDPRRDRPVDDDSQLIADYDYSHPGEFLVPELFAEGATQIIWYKDNALIPAFHDQKVIPPTATKPNERWFYTVTPQTISGLSGAPIQGMLQMSPVVTIVALPRVLNVVLPEDLPSEVTPGIVLTNLPLAAGPTTGGTTVAILGKRLGHPVSVTFGGIEAQSIKSIDEFRLEAVTPAHTASFVIQDQPIGEDVVVVTPAGPSTLPEAFAFVDTGTSISKADVNRDGVVDAVDVQFVINAVLATAKSGVDADVNRDGRVNALDIQVVVNEAVGR